MDLGNISAEALSQVNLRLAVPSGVSVGNISAGGSVETATGDVIWTLASLASGGVIHREITLTADANLVDGQILASRLEMRHAGSSETAASSEEVVTVASNALVTASLAVSPNPVVAGGLLNTTITVSNTSSAAVDNVFVLYRVPRGLSFAESINANPNPDFASCATTSSANICVAGNEVFWTLGTLVAGESQIITINSAVATELVSGQLINTQVVITGLNVDTLRLQKTVSIQ